MSDQSAIRNPKSAMDQTTNVLICGVGGQGILKASEVLGVAAMKAGFHVKKSEVHGMAQRGGSVESHVRFGSRVESPLIEPGTADYLVCFDAEEGERMSFYLKPGGVDFRPYLAAAARDLPDPRFLNTYLTAVLSLYLPIEERVWLEALREVITKKVDENAQVFRNARTKGKAV
jgi:indolepyruvate ferredoxin oxidoreductase beta subunit